MKKKSLNNLKIFLAGHNGMVGQALLKQLKKNGAKKTFAPLGSYKKYCHLWQLTFFCLTPNSMEFPWKPNGAVLKLSLYILSSCILSFYNAHCLPFVLFTSFISFLTEFIGPDNVADASARLFTYNLT